MGASISNVNTVINNTPKTPSALDATAPVNNALDVGRKIPLENIEDGEKVGVTPDGVELQANKDQPFGYPGLDDGGFIHEAEIPVLSAAKIGHVNTSALPTFLSRSFTGLAAPGAISVSAFNVGDVVLGLWAADGSVDNASNDFEASISQGGQIQQVSAVDYSLKRFNVLLTRNPSMGPS